MAEAQIASSSRRAASTVFSYCDIAPSQSFGPVTAAALVGGGAESAAGAGRLVEDEGPAPERARPTVGGEARLAGAAARDARSFRARRRGRGAPPPAAAARRAEAPARSPLAPAEQT